MKTRKGRDKPNRNKNRGRGRDNNERELITEIAADTVTLLDRRYPKPAPILRGVHPKSHGCVKGSFTINADLPDDLCVGLFSTPGERFDAVVRFSNATTTVACDLADGKNGSRGMAIKVMDVKGEVLQDDDGRSSQDFLMINTPNFVFANTEDYHRLTKVLLENNDSPDAFFAPLKIEVPGITPEDKARISKSAQVVGKISITPVANPVEVPYFGAAPFRFGARRVMRFSAMPRVAPDAQTLPGQPVPCDYLNEALTARMAQSETVVFDFKVQVRDRADVTDLDDATSVWDEAETPWVSVATLVLDAPQTDINSAANLKACEDLVFTPWHALRKHKPLGQINRLRKRVYKASATHRCPMKTD